MKAVPSLIDSSSLKNPSTECIMEGLEICLLHNNSGFANIHLLQIVLQLEHQTHVLIPIKQLVILIRSLMKRELHNFRHAFLGRYHDNHLHHKSRDIGKINDFQKLLSTLDEKFKYMIEIRGSSICFLDLKIFIEGNRLETTVYSKPTKSHLYLEASSCHKKSSKIGK